MRGVTTRSDSAARRLKFLLTRLMRGVTSHPQTCVSREQLNSVALLSLTPRASPHAALIHPLLPSGHTDVWSSTYTLQTPWVPS